MPGFDNENEKNVEYEHKSDPQGDWCSWSQSQIDRLVVFLGLHEQKDSIIQQTALVHLSLRNVLSIAV